MTADERIEALLNRFGQTISDLPKPYLDEKQRAHYAYSIKHSTPVYNTVVEWSRIDGELRFPQNPIGCYKDYICHLVDVIDRMEAALETAANWGWCYACDRFDEHIFPECEASNGPCFHMNDSYFYDEDCSAILNEGKE